MLSLYQVQTIISQCIRRMTSNNQKYVRSKTLAKMGIISSIRFNGFVDKVYNDPTVGLPYYQHSLPINAFDDLSPDSKLSEVEDVVIKAEEVPGIVKNPTP